MGHVRLQAERLRLGMVVPERQLPRPKQRGEPAKVEKFVDRSAPKVHTYKTISISISISGRLRARPAGRDGEPPHGAGVLPGPGHQHQVRGLLCNAK
jgi:hypothetical protein